MATPHEQSGSNAVLQSRVLNVIQGLILSGIVWFGHSLTDLTDKVGAIQTSQAALAAHVDDVKFELERANLQQMRDDITVLKAHDTMAQHYPANRHSLPSP